jgi:hypothetical protein
MTNPTPRHPGFIIEPDEPPPPSKTSTDDTDSATRSRRKNYLQTRSAETLVLRGVSVPLNSDIGGAFVTDASRNRERLFSDQRLMEKYGLTMAGWKEIAKNEAFLLAVAAEVERRTYNGDSAREAAAKQFTEAPQVLGNILRNEHASPRHRIEAAKELRATANTGNERAGDTADRVIVTINLGGDEKLVVDSGPLPPKQAKDALDAE